MNILAHLYLSGNDGEIIFGNFIGDYVKGNKVDNYADKVAQGIKLHRAIDYFTDNHENVKKVNLFFREKYGKHAGIVTDIIFDHFLYRNWARFSDQDIDSFIREKHNVLNDFIKHFPKKVIEFYPYFVINNWIKLYGTLDGIKRVLRGMSKRTSLPGEYHFAVSQTEENHQEIEQLFIDFFYEISDFVEYKFDITVK